MWPFHTHRWKIVSAWHDAAAHYLAVQECGGGPSGNFGVTHVAMRCTLCGDLKEKSIRGWHTIENLQSLEVFQQLEKLGASG